ncbi:MAG: CBS domain-containing protein [Phycisphaerales bacterium]|nr:MAG: CBS domain-containing protein [Phycisphaerales bacterium]
MPNAQEILDKKGTDVATVDRKATVLDAARLMNERRIGAVVVTGGENAVGIFTERDILDRVVAAGKGAGQTAVDDVMTSPMACCRRDSTLEECKTVMTDKRIRHLPVVEEGKLYGLISSGDIIAYESANQQATIEYLHEYLYRRR